MVMVPTTKLKSVAEYSTSKTFVAQTFVESSVKVGLVVSTMTVAWSDDVLIPP